MKLLQLISRIFVGSVFIFSGFVKAVDPTGFVYKLTDYFDAFNMSFFSALVYPLAFFLIGFEMLLGVALFIGFRMKIAAWAILIMESFFTILTLIVAITNPVTDCGCFGDALIITNWQTFWKNIILMAFVYVIFRYRKDYLEFYNDKVEWGTIIVVFSIIIGFQVYNYKNLPIIDFRPYHIGSNIQANMEIPEGAPIDEYEITLVYEKNGVKKEFKLGNYRDEGEEGEEEEKENNEWQDGTWTWIETKQKLIKKGYTPPIHDFSITNLDGEDITQTVLDDPYYTFLVISYNIDKSKPEFYQALDEIYMYSQQLPEFSFYALTSSLESDIQELIDETGINYPFYTTDEITLKTIVRSNPGLVLLKDGTVIGKWHYNNLPSVEEIKSTIGPDLLTSLLKQKQKNIVWAYIFLFGLGICLFYIFAKKFKPKQI